MFEFVVGVAGVAVVAPSYMCICGYISIVLPFGFSHKAFFPRFDCKIALSFIFLMLASSECE